MLFKTALALLAAWVIGVLIVDRAGDLVHVLLLVGLGLLLLAFLRARDAPLRRVASDANHDAVAHPLHFWVNEIGMVFFFALAPKKSSRRHSPADPWRQRDSRSRRSRLRSAEWSDRH
jgi:hypothetical protein